MATRYVKITSKSYGNTWKGFRIHYLGARPKMLKEDGSFLFGKHILESLSHRFKKNKFTLTLLKGKSKIVKQKQKFAVFISLADINQMKKVLWARTRDVKQRVVSSKFSEIYGRYFKEGARLYSYEENLLCGILTETFLPARLSKDDRKALADFIPRFIASGVAKNATTSKIKAGLELKVLKTLAHDLEQRIHTDKSESAWQDYLKQNILYIQQGYIELIPKANIGVLDTSYPDFLLVTYDGYLDILEIKTPFTQLLLEDKSHNNYYWSADISKAIAQVENYIQAIVDIGDKVRSKVKDTYDIELRVIKPRGIIFAGNSSQFNGKKMIQDDYRLLSQGLKNVAVVTYDELFTRLQNYISVLAGIKSSK